METWNKRMARALAQSDYNPNSFATAMGVSAPTVAGWIGAANIAPTQHIKSELMLRACQLLNIRPQWLILKEGPMRGAEQVELTDEMRKIIDLLIDVDREKGDRRKDIIFWVNRLLTPVGKGDQKTG